MTNKYYSKKKIVLAIGQMIYCMCWQYFTGNVLLSIDQIMFKCSVSGTMLIFLSGFSYYHPVNIIITW